MDNQGIRRRTESFLKHHKSPSNILLSLKTREYRFQSTPQYRNLTKSVQKVLNNVYNSVPEATNMLKIAIDSGTYQEIERELSVVISKLFDATNNNPQTIFSINSNKRQEREVFVLLGGISQLIRIFHGPYGRSDARLIPSDDMKRKSEFWNEILFILREVSFTIPSIAESAFADRDIIFLFTLLSHTSVYENTIFLLEELLATRSSTFLLGSVPDVFQLLTNFSVRKLSQFCRVLSLLLFDQEDRQIQQGSHVLRSLELLEMRRDRMTKLSNKVEKNQFLVISCPRLLERLVQIVRVLNYGPNHREFSTQSSSQSSMTSEILHFLTGSYSNSEASWGCITQLENICLKSASINNEPTSSASVSDDADDFVSQLISAFYPSSQSGVDITSFYRIFRIAREIGIDGGLTDNHSYDRSDDDLNEPSATISRAWTKPSSFPSTPTSSSRAFSGRSREDRNARVLRQELTPIMAKKQLQFYSMLLLPTQIEVLFVICSLLSGRRKIYVQKKLFHLKLDEALYAMYDRLSWDCKSLLSNPLHGHGPVCECNPESALRVQYLRLVLNFYDRDFMHNENKSLMLSVSENQWINDQNVLLFDNRAYKAYNELNIMNWKISEGSGQGLVSKIVSTFLLEPFDSMYRFWLSSCIEVFLRGHARSFEQVFVSEKGVMASVVDNILTLGSKSSVNLQTSFDLLGELIKCNEVTIEMLEYHLVDDESFQLFLQIVMDNLVDSNVFVRMLFITMDHVNSVYQNSVSDEQEVSANESLRSSLYNSSGRITKAGYLSDTWLPFAPRPLSKKGIKLFTATPAHVLLHRSNKHSQLKRSPAVRPSMKLSISDRIHDAFTGFKDVATNFLGNGPATPSKHPLQSPHSGVSSPTREESLYQDFISIPSSLNMTAYGVSESGMFNMFGGNASPANDVIMGMVDDNDGDDSFESLITPSDQAHNQRNGHMPTEPSTQQGIHHKYLSSMMKGEEPVDHSPIPATPPKGWVLPDSLFRLSFFLSQERDRILLRLISAITLRTINHENICCLNTALMILNSGHRRNELPLILKSVRLVATSISNEYSSMLKSTVAAREEIYCIKSEVTSPEISCNSCTAKYCVSDRGGICSCIMLRGSPQRSRHSPSIAASRKVMKNFRELLWFWCEYYLRRGRDRLSIEFSSRIPFKELQTLVGLLCADDGSPTSLLKHPIAMPRSPYVGAHTHSEEA